MIKIEKKYLVKACYYPSVLISSWLSDKMVRNWVLFDNRIWNMVGSLAMVEALYRSGRVKFSEALLENLISGFVQKRKFIPNYKERYLIAKKGKPSFYVSFPDTLRLFLDILYPLGLKPFLAFGTLLGHERNQGFIPWDLDIDLGIFDDNIDFQALIASLKSSPFKILKCSPLRVPFKIKCALKGGPMIELVIFKKVGDHLMTYSMLFGETVERKRDVFGLKKSTMEGIPVYVPENATRFLEENYGDWQNPRSIHHFLFDSHLTDFSRPLIRVYAKKYFYELLSNGDQQKSRYYLDLFKKKFSGEQFWKNIEDKLIQCLK
jgi:hypothetical protein